MHLRGRSVGRLRCGGRVGGGCGSVGGRGRFWLMVVGRMRKVFWILD